MTALKLDLATYSSLATALLLLVPGVVIVYIRRLFINGKQPSGGEIALQYFAVSALYQAFAYPLIKLIANASGTSILMFWPILVFIFPAAIGAFLGIEIHRGWFRQRLRRFGVNPVHPTPGAWDWRLGNMSECWVFVTLKNEFKYAGRLGKSSFASSESAERDLYIEKLYSWDEDGDWKPLNRSLLICGGEISTIEFIEDITEGAENEEAEQSHTSATTGA